MTTRQMTRMIAAMLFMAAGWTHAATLLEWGFGEMVSTSGYGNEGLTFSSSPGVSSTGLWRGAGVWTVGTTMGRSWGGRNFFYSKEEALSTDVCFYFDIMADAGFTLTLTSIETPWCGSPQQSPEYGQWQYSLDGGTGWTDIGGAETLPHGSYDWVYLDLSGIEDLKEVSGVTFRLVLWGGESGTNGRFSFGTGTASGIGPSLPNALTINGILNIPEPSAMTLLVFGSAAFLLRRRKQK